MPALQVGEADAHREKYQRLIYAPAYALPRHRIHSLAHKGGHHRGRRITRHHARFTQLTTITTMKLLLPKALLTAIMAGFALQAQADIPTTSIHDLPKSEDFFETYIANDTHLSLQGVFPGTLPDGYDENVENYWSAVTILWQPETKGSYTMTGEGTLRHTQLLAWTASDYTIGSGIKLQGNCTLAPPSGGTLRFEGSVDESASNNLIFQAGGEGVLDFSKATLGDSKVTLEYLSGSGTFIADSFRLEGSNGTVKTTIRLATYSLSGTSTVRTFSGNLILDDGGRILFEDFSALNNYFDENNNWVSTPLYRDNSLSYPGLRIDGTLTIAGATELCFPGWISDFDSETGSSTYTPLTITEGTVLFTCSELEGAENLYKLKLLSQEGEMSDPVNTYNADLSDTYHLSYVLNNGVYEIRVMDGATEIPSAPEDEEQSAVTSGSIEGTLSNEPGRNVWLTEGNTVDATRADNLSNEFIKGTGGTLVIGKYSAVEDNQGGTMTMTGTDRINYNIVTDVESPLAGRVIIGRFDGNLGDANITLAGKLYDVGTVDVLSGQLIVESDTVLGNGESTVTLGSGTAEEGDVTATINNFGKIAGNAVLNDHASLDNRGTITGDVLLESGSELANNGVIEGITTVSSDARLQGCGSYTGVVVESGGRMHIGNSPGYSTVSSLRLDKASTLSFTVDGTTAATTSSYGEGTYSQMVVSDTLTFNGVSNAEVEITSGILKAGTGTFTLTLLDASTATVADNSGAETPLEATITEGEELLKDGYELAWDAERGILTLTGEVNLETTTQQLTPDGSAIANTLWSSTSAVRSFARTATSQLSAPPSTTEGYSVWGSVLGDYVSMSGFRSNSHGYAVGVDKQFCPSLRAGLALGQMFGDFTADEGLAEVDQDSVMVALYSEYLREINQKHSFSLTTYAAYGSTGNDATTHVGGSSSLPGSASWNDDVFALGTRASWNIRMSDKLTLTPFIGLEYIHGSQDSFTENFSGGSRSYRDGSMQVWSMPIGITARTEVEFGLQKLLPEVTFAYVGDISRKNPHVRSSTYGLDINHKGTNPGRSAFMMNVGTNWVINDNWSAGAFYNLETRSQEVSQEASISVRCSF